MSSHATRSSAPEGVKLLQVFALAVMLVPSNTVIGAVGASGYPAGLFGAFVFLIFMATVLFGFHDPTRHRHPIQGVLCLLWLSVLASYVLMDRGAMTDFQLRSADRMLIMLAVITGVALVAAEWLRSLSDIRRVLRALCWGGAACALIAVVQFAAGFDLAQYLRELPGFTQNHDNPAIVARGALNRATGTAITAIELGVVAGMLLPLSIYLGMHDRDIRPARRWAPTVLITMGVACSVSRSGIIAVVVAFGVLVVLLPPVPRVAALCALPFAVMGAFVSAHGLIGTLATFFSAGKSDPSIEYRLHDYPLAEKVWQEAPWFGHGGGTWIPADQLNIFDNQYLNSAVELGLVGIVALLVFLVAPAIIALRARKRSRNPELRQLAAALAAAGFVAPASSLTFDSLSFPMFVNVYALVLGITGACWRLAAAERAPTRAPRDAAARVWRRKAVAAPVLGLVVIGVVYVMIVQSPVYAASSTWALINPPPTPLNLKAAPRGADNPYMRYSDRTAVERVVLDRVTSARARLELEKRGARPGYTVEPAADFGFGAPVLQITGTASDPAAAIRTAEIVGQRLDRELTRMQDAYGVAAMYRIDAQEVVAPGDVTVKAFDRLRALILVLVSGTLLLFVALSARNFISAVRRARANRLIASPS